MDLDCRALAHAELLCERIAQGIGGEAAGLDQPLLAVGRIGHDNRGPSCGAFGVELFQRFKLHDL